MKVGEIEVLPVFDGFGYEVARDVLLIPGETDPWARHQERLDAHGRLEFTLGGFLPRAGQAGQAGQGGQTGPVSQAGQGGPGDKTWIFL